MGLIKYLALALIAPFLGMVLALAQQEPLDHIHAEHLVLDFQTLTDSADHIRQQNSVILTSVGLFNSSLAQQQQHYQEQQQLIQQLIQESLAQKQLSNELYEQQLLAKLGKVRDSYQSEKFDIKLFDITGLSYRGYLAKIRLHDPSAIRVVLGRDEYGQVETTQQAVQRNNAIFGVNGGGFFSVHQEGQSRRLPLGNTMVDGKLVGNFSPSRDDVFFAGFSKEGALVGGQFSSVHQLINTRAMAGVSFVPILMQDRLPVPIPARWQNARHPRTIVGNFGNGDLFFLVIDGRQPNWSRGATLEEIQVKLLGWGAINAYNLDGGGSSTLVFKNKLINRPSDGAQRPVATNILLIP